MHDWYLSLIASALGEVIYINKPTVKYRQHNKNAIGAKKIFDLKYIYRRVIKSYLIKSDLQKVFNQAKAFKDNYYEQLSCDNRKILNEFCKLTKQSKILKIQNITKNKFYKHGLIRKIGEYIYI